MEGNDTNKQIGGKVRSTWDTFNSSEIYAIYSSSLFFNPDHLNCLYMYSSSVESTWYLWDWLRALEPRSEGIPAKVREERVAR